MSDALYWERLRRTLETMVDEFDGVAGLSLYDLVKDRRLEINGDEQFPTASTIKIHLLAALEQLHFQGELNLDDRVKLLPEHITPGSGVLAFMDDDVELSWRDIANLMIIVSDNTATNMIIDLLGYDRMAGFMEKWGLEKTILRRKMQEHDAVARNEENLSTPNEEVKILELLRDGSAFGEGVGEECLRILKKSRKGFIKNGVPVSVPVANKPGAMDFIRCDAAIVYLPRRPYILSVATKYGNMEPRVQEGWIAEVSATIYHVMSLMDITSGWGQGVPPAYLS